MTILTAAADENHLSSMYGSTFLKTRIFNIIFMRKLYKSILWLIAISISCITSCITVSFAQSAKNSSPVKSKIEISGNLIAATDFKSIYTNYGGPAVKFSLSEKLYACISMYPGLRWKNDTEKPTVLPILGAGMHVGYKSLILALPFYYISNENKWKTAIGAGIRFK